MLQRLVLIVLLPAKMAIDHFNTLQKNGVRKIELVVEDDQYLTAKTISAYQKLVFMDHVKFIFVITYGGLLSLALRAQRDGVILIDPLDCNASIASLPRNTLCIAHDQSGIGNFSLTSKQ